MAIRIEKTRNTNDEAVDVGASTALNSSTSTKIADSNSNRIFFSVSNNSNKAIWLKLQPATTDNDHKGIYMEPHSYWEMPVENTYIGEVSAISDSGTPTVYVTEY